MIKEGTASYAAWKETPIPVYTKFYFFDMLNPQVIAIVIAIVIVIVIVIVIIFIPSRYFYSIRRSCSTGTRCQFLKSAALTLSERWRGK